MCLPCRGEVGGALRGLLYNMTERRKIEVCCGSAADVVEARCGGASRIELCSALEVGGLTPSIGLIRMAKQQLGAMQLGVIVRPRGGDFVYSEQEIATMEEDIRELSREGVDVIVIGALTDRGDVDSATCRRLMEAAPEKSFTFHRAFDVCAHPEEALEEIIRLGFDRLLTSGCQPTALEGLPLIQRLVQQVNGRITIMPGSGINPMNIDEIEQQSGATEFHSTARGEARIHPVYENPALSFGENEPRKRTEREVVRRLVEKG